MTRRSFLQSLGLFTAAMTLPIDLIIKKVLQPETLPIQEYITITFVGTGLDVATEAKGAIALRDVMVDGMPISSIGSLEDTRMVTGLPYGVHNVKFAGPKMASLGILAPSKPKIPWRSTYLGSYYRMSEYNGSDKGAHVVTYLSARGKVKKVQNPVGKKEDVIRKYNFREFGPPSYGYYHPNDEVFILDDGCTIITRRLIDVV